jgi:hypothetical protein
MAQHHQARLYEAQLNWKNYTNYGALARQAVGSTDVSTGKPLTQEDLDKYKAWSEEAFGRYAKVAGVSKEAKQRLQAGKQRMDILAQMHDRSRQGQASGGQGGSPAISPQGTATSSGGKPISGAGGPKFTGGQPGGATPMPTASSTTPAQSSTTGTALQAPPQAPSKPDYAASYGSEGMARAWDAAAGLEHQRRMKEQQEEDDAKFKDWTRQQDKLKQNKIEEEQSKVEAEAKEKAKYGVGSGKVKVAKIHYAGPDGKPLFGWSFVDPADPMHPKLYDQEMNELPAGTTEFSAWMTPRTTEGWHEVQVPQPDGSIKIAVVRNESTVTRGDKTAPTTSTAAPPKGSKGGSSSSTGGAGGPGRTVGGKSLPGVAKAYETYNTAEQRYAVMQDSYARATKDPHDQQAQLNLLANHVGMTLGLQKGARITQAFYEEALGSREWAAGIEAHFTGPPDPVTGEPTLDMNPAHYKQGVVLTQKQMDQMMPLAKVMMDQTKDSWHREIEAAKTGYGMAPPPSPKPAPPKKDRKPLASFDR